MPTNPQPDPPPESQSGSPAERPANSLPSGLLLAATGGLLDAFVYLNHGHVFASAMTGNGVLMGIAMLNQDWFQALRHLSPAIAFMAGVAVSKSLNKLLGTRAAAAGLLLEIFGLLIASWLPASFPQLAFTALIAFVASYQVSSFRKVDEFSYNSTFITGNMRSVGDGLFDTLSPETRAAGRRKSRDLSLVILCFLAGAALGALLAPRFANHTLWFAEPFLLAVLAIVLLKPQQPPTELHLPNPVS